MSGLMANKFSVTVPDGIEGEVSLSDAYANYYKNGGISSWALDMTCKALQKHRTVKAKEVEILIPKVEGVLAAWAKELARKRDQDARQASAEHAAQLTASAKSIQADLESLLTHTLSVNDAIDWERAIHLDKFSPHGNDEHEAYIVRDGAGRPKGWKKLAEPPAPNLQKMMEQAGFLGRVFRKKAVHAEYARQLKECDEAVARVEQQNAGREIGFTSALSAYDEALAVVARLKASYEQRDRAAIEEYCDLVLSESNYPDLLPKNWDLEYNPDSKTLILVYDLPDPSVLPRETEYRFIRSRNVIEPKLASAAAQKKLFESVAYQLCLRTIHEVFEADTINVIGGVTFNGRVTHTNPATGIEECKIILSVFADKAEFLALDLAKVDPRSTFRYLKGVSASQLVDLAAVPPLALPQTLDKRLIEGREVISQVDKGTNLASMRWDDFEHLVRELFEAEFGSGTAEVRVTQASADGGVDAIVFDSDPIRGGKIVIQAKRYTNTVGVSAVRDLYGTVMNEGAMKGILITTSDYGADSYSFARDKPLTLLNGGNLLDMISRHGHKAYINIQEAREQLRLED